MITAQLPVTGAFLDDATTGVDIDRTNRTFQRPSRLWIMTCPLISSHLEFLVDDGLTSFTAQASLEDRVAERLAPEAKKRNLYLNNIQD